jgi:hypothetical protein
MPAGVGLAPAHLFTATFCPAMAGVDLLSAKADGKGQSFQLRAILAEDCSPAEIHVAGLSAEHAGLALARALAEQLGRRGTGVIFRADLSTFLAPEEAPDRLRDLERAGVGIVGNDPL